MQISRNLRSFGIGLAAVHSDEALDSLKSEERGTVGVLRSREIEAFHFWLSTGGLYDLCTISVQSVDKKKVSGTPERYPQVKPQAQTLFYRGFQVHIPL